MKCSSLLKQNAVIEVLVRHTCKALIFKFRTIDADSSSSLQPLNTLSFGLVLKHLPFGFTPTHKHTHRTHISFSEVPSLDHEIFNNTVKGTSFVAIAFLSCIWIFQINLQSAPLYNLYQNNNYNSGSSHNAS